VGVPVRSFLEVVVPVRSGSHHARLRRQVEHVSSGTAVSARFVQVAGSAAGIVGNRDQPGSCGEVAGTGEGAQVADTDQQCGAEERRAGTG
jgi:hypothetical protein